MDRVCPLLGLAGDRRTAVDGVDASHRCHAERPPATLDRLEQSQLCLTPAHPRCPRYLAYVARGQGGVPGRFAVGDGLVSTRLVLAPSPAWRGIAGQARRAPRTPVVIGATAALLVGAGAVAAGAAVLDGRLDLVGTGARSPSPSPSAASEDASPTATPSARPTPSPSPSPTPDPTASPTATPGVTPVPPAATPVPTPVTYVVQEGDTLAEIAQRFGTTVEALQVANDIEDPNEIIIGDVLVIP